MRDPKTTPSTKTTRNIIIAAIGILIVVPLSRQFGQAAGEAQNEREAQSLAQSTGGPEAVQAIVSRQPSEGVTEANLDQSFLAGVEEWTLERMRVHMTRNLAQMGKSLSPNDLMAESVYLEVGGRKLAVTRIKFENVTIAAQIFGIQGNEAVRVMCVTDQPRDVAITSGPCSDKVREAFGVSLNPMENSNG